MKVPGFNAEASVYRTKLHYHAAGEPALAQASVLPLFITHCPGQGPPTVEAYWQPDGKGGGTVLVTGTNFPVGVGPLYVRLATNCLKFTPLRNAYPQAWVTCYPWEGCCFHSYFSVALPLTSMDCTPIPCCGPTCQGTVTATYLDPMLPSASTVVQMPC